MKNIKELIDIEMSYKNNDRKKAIIDFIDFCEKNNEKVSIETEFHVEYDAVIEWKDEEKTSFGLKDDGRWEYPIERIDHINFSLKRIFVK